MPQPKKPSSPDSLTKSGKGASIELAESELDKVAGGGLNNLWRHPQLMPLAFLLGIKP